MISSIIGNSNEKGKIFEEQKQSPGKLNKKLSLEKSKEADDSEARIVYLTDFDDISAMIP